MALHHAQLYYISQNLKMQSVTNPDSKVHVANMGLSVSTLVPWIFQTSFLLFFID